MPYLELRLLLTTLTIYKFVHENKIFLAWQELIFKLHNPETGTVAQLAKHLFCDWEFVGLIPSLLIPKTLKMELAVLLLDAQHLESKVRNRN